MLCALKEDWIKHILDGTSVISIKRNGSWNSNAQLSKKSKKPYDCGTDRRHGAVFSLSRCFGYLVLFLVCPRNNSFS